MNANQNSNALVYIAIGIAAASLLAALLFESLLPPLLLVIFIFGVAFVFLAFQKPWVFVYLISIGSYLSSLVYFFDDFPLPITLFQAFLILGLGLFLLHRMYYNSFSLRLTGYELPILLFLALIFLSLIYSPDRANGMFNTVRFIVLLIFAGYILNTIYSFRLTMGLFAVLTLVAVLLSGYSAMEIILNPQVAAQNILSGGMNIDRGSAGGIYHDPNRFAAMLFLPVAFTFSVINSDMQLRYKTMAAIAFLVLVGGLFSTFSRSGTLSVMVILLIVVALYKNWKMAGLFGIAGLLIVLAVPQLRDVFFLNIERVADVFFGTRDDSSGIRVMLGIAAVQMFLDSYMIGIGFDGFSERFTSYYTLQESIGVNEPHNITYTLMAELGLIGLLFFLYYLYVMGYHAIKNFRLSASPQEKVAASTLLSSFSAYILFYQFYGGALTDSNLMLIHALIFVVFFQLIDKNELSNQIN